MFSPKQKQAVAGVHSRTGGGGARADNHSLHQAFRECRMAIRHKTATAKFNSRKKFDCNKVTGRKVALIRAPFGGGGAKRPHPVS